MKTWHWIALGILFLLVFSSGGTTGENIVQRIANAIAMAEGFYIAGSVPQRRNNPGDIVGPDGVVIAYASIADGWEALRNQVRLMLGNTSSFYNSGMTIYEVAIIYTGGDNPSAWAHTVAAELGVTPDTPIGALA